MNYWRNEAEMDRGVIDALKGVVGDEAFAEMTKQFAVDLERLHQAYISARACSDDRAAREAAHAIKGAASNIGLARLGMLAGLLESGNVDDEIELDPVFESALKHLNTNAG
jgi:HPt (histidine-containing phosphotransfer) domain-containing protein